MWCIPALTAVFIRKMLDVLEVYEREYDPKRPVICLDEKSMQLLGDVRKPEGTKRGKVKREDYEYKRHGTVNLFVTVEPKGKKRKVCVTDRRTKEAFAKVVRQIVMEEYKDAEKVVLVVDNLNIHRAKSLIDIFGEEEGQRIADRIEWHWTPAHCSWLDQAEIEIHVLSTQCLDRRIATKEEVVEEVAAWEKERNRQKKGINWQFTRAKAKRKFKLELALT